MAYTEAHRILLTYIRGLKVVSSESLLQAYQTLCQEMDLETGSDIQVSLSTFISEINMKLDKFNFRISSIRDQSTEEILYVFVNTEFDEAIQDCTNYTPPELDCIKQLVDNIINSHGYVYSLLYKITKQLIMGVLKVKGSDADFFLQRMVDDGWIELSAHKKVVVSSATLVELHGYMIDRFGVFSQADSAGKLLECVLCKELVMMGKKCANNECYKAFHNKCYTLYIRDQTECPNRACERLLGDTITVGVQ